MITPIALATCSLVLLGTVVALVREVRLRRALQRLLFRLLTLWRSRHEKNRAPSSEMAHPDPLSDPRRL